MAWPSSVRHCLLTGWLSDDKLLLIEGYEGYDMIELGKNKETVFANSGSGRQRQRHGIGTSQKMPDNRPAESVHHSHTQGQSESGREPSLCFVLDFFANGTSVFHLAIGTIQWNFSSFMTFSSMFSNFNFPNRLRVRPAPRLISKLINDVERTRLYTNACSAWEFIKASCCHNCNSYSMFYIFFILDIALTLRMWTVTPQALSWWFILFLFWLYVDCSCWRPIILTMCLGSTHWINWSTKVPHNLLTSVQSQIRSTCVLFFNSLASTFINFQRAV